METIIQSRQEIIKQLQLIPDSNLTEVSNYLQYLIYRANIEQNKAIQTPNTDVIKTHVASEKVLSKDWLSKEEEEAWSDL